MKVVDVEVQDVEIVGFLKNPAHHYHVVGQGIGYIRVESQSPFTRRDKPCLGLAVSRSEQGHVMTHPNQLLGQVGNHTFRAAIKLRRAALIERRDLGNTHKNTLAEGRSAPC